MMTARRRVLVTYPPSPQERDAFGETLGGLADIAYLSQMAKDERAGALASTDVVVARSGRQRPCDEMSSAALRAGTPGA
jgi:hypothetical protein